MVMKDREPQDWSNYSITDAEREALERLQIRPDVGRYTTGDILAAYRFGVENMRQAVLDMVLDHRA